ncbi:hypothetical protein [Blautia obeum]|uniref:hypothetical protein n=1 Tax=Blautia obeum TaxID=40520 RepID=UPI002A78E361|nr:hypothetical protein [Lachnospiraceae bacterium]MDY2613907.1 hypothetical protein [Lachnospiraceae bacterium]MDY4206758.1 hypothetical protein [Lachnospiraceae bacterium]MDY5025534.1 hypothetical protein [Oliverpabstia sp.]
MSNEELLQSISEILDQRFNEQDARIEQRFAEQDAWIKQSFAKQQAYIDHKLEEQQAYIDHKLEEHRTAVDEKFESNNHYLMNSILEEVDLVQEKANEHFARIENRLDNLESLVRTIKLDADTIPLHEIRISNLEKHVDKLEQIAY